MKKTMGICLFTVILTMCIAGSVKLIDIWENRNNKIEIGETTEEPIQTEQAEFAESMQIQKQYRYLLIEEDGTLVVYEEDGKTLLIETNIQLHGLDEETRSLLQEGIWVTDEKELYDLLESYSS